MLELENPNPFLIEGVRVFVGYVLLGAISSLAFRGTS